MTPFQQPSGAPAPVAPQLTPEQFQAVMKSQQEARAEAQKQMMEKLDSTTAVAGGGPAERILNGITIKFAELSFYDRRDLIREWRKVQRTELAASLREAGVTGPQAYAELRDFDDVTRKGGENIWVQFFDSDDAKINILTWSLRRSAALNNWPTDANQLEVKVQEVVKSIASKWPEVSRLCALLTNTPIFADTLKAPPPPMPEKQTDPTTAPASAAPTGPTETPPSKGFGTL